MGLSNELYCEAGSFSRQHNPHRFFQSGVLRLYFPTLEPWVAWSVLLPSFPPGLFAHKCGITCSVSCHLALSASQCLATGLLCLAAHLCPSYQFGCFFFNSLVVRLPYSSIFCQFWLFLIFKFVVVLLLVVRGGTVCLPMPPSWPEVDFADMLMNYIN